MITVTGLHVYPLKSGSGTDVAAVELLRSGLRHDREFMLVDPAGRHLSQRELRRMALLRTSYDGSVLTVNDFVHRVVDDGEALKVTVHGSPCAGVDQGEAAAAYFSAFLDTPCRLVRFAGSRAVSTHPGEVMFGDAYSLLVISEESLADLNGRLERPLPMNRFRPNIVLSGLGAFGEDGVRRLRIGGGVEIDLVKPCARCVITTTDQETAEKGREPLATLAGYRTGRWNGVRGIMFGQNAVPVATGTLQLGDPVEVLEYSA